MQGTQWMGMVLLFAAISPFVIIMGWQLYDILTDKR